MKSRRKKNKKRELLVVIDPKTLERGGIPIVESEDYDFGIATSGKEAEAVLKDEKFVLLLIQTNLGDECGFELSNSLVDGVSYHLPFIFISDNYDTVETIEYGLSLGAIDFLYKPFSTKLLNQRIRNHFIQARQYQQLSESRRRFRLLLDQVSEQAKELKDGIEYASLIQDCAFDSVQEIERKYSDVFLFHRSKDSVGGDFYYVNEVNNRLIVVCADSAGHGVPGALLSILGYQIFKEVIEVDRIVDPGEILEQVDAKLNAFFNGQNRNGHYSIDASVAAFSYYDNQVKVASAKRPVVVSTETDSWVLSGANRSLGDFKRVDVPFVSFNYSVDTEMEFFLFSDGVTDQFGGESAKKFGKRQLLEVIDDCHISDRKERKNYFGNLLTDWMEDEEQIDDMTMIGLQLEPSKLSLPIAKKVRARAWVQ